MGLRRSSAPSSEEERRGNCFRRTMKAELKTQSRLLIEKSLLGCCRSTAPDELRTARCNHP